MMQRREAGVEWPTKLLSHFRGLNDAQVRELIPYPPLLLGYRGSIAHGCYVPQSDPGSIDDKDVMGFYVPPLEHYFGFRQHPHHEKQMNEWDVVMYELRKGISLLRNCNPNVLSLLWLHPTHYIHVAPAGEELIKNRHIFVSRKIYHSFTGYALSQLKKMTHFVFEGYMGDKRKSLVEKHGYDCKSASHLIRLLRMGIEFLREGELHVLREDAPQLLEIKAGKWKLEEVKAEADRLFIRAQAAYDECSLPSSPDDDAIGSLTQGILLDCFGFPRAQKIC